MGADIYAIIFYQEYGPTSKDYFKFCTLSLPRSYVVFSALAGVRGELEPKIPPRGFPDNFRYYDRDYLGDHTFSWMNAEEFKSALDQVETETQYEVHHEYRIVQMILEQLPFSIIVFGFDS